LLIYFSIYIKSSKILKPKIETIGLTYPNFHLFPKRTNGTLGVKIQVIFSKNGELFGQKITLKHLIHHPTYKLWGISRIGFFVEIYMDIYAYL